jgi:adenylyltransferase/sulfurtransferase
MMPNPAPHVVVGDVVAALHLPPPAGRLQKRELIDEVGSAAIRERRPDGDHEVLAGSDNRLGGVEVVPRERGPCYRCLFPEPPPPGAVPSCAEGGVLGVLPGIIGTLQALEVIKLILGKGDVLIGQLVLFDALAFEFRKLKLRKDASCPVCGNEPSIRELIDYDAFCGVAAPATVNEDDYAALSVEEYDAIRDDVALLDVRNPHEFDLACMPGATLIPLPELAARLTELDPRRSYVVTCHHGPRSIQAYYLLQDAGFRRVQILSGGIDAWAERIDPSMPRY